MNSDDEVLHSLDCYETALRRVSADFGSRGAAVEPVSVRLGALAGVLVDYRVAGGGDPYTVGTLPMVTTVEEAVVALADLLQEEALECGDTAWPGCRPGHPHPPTPCLSGGTAVWSCPRDATALAGIG
ncbi:hypothetical protein [Micromonospora halophytica]|uniref:Uncharacterized protein n=1 Tax=Micromonospora halophytica TaxID=47864 RepID=A0A1C5IB45_9ACTN|nr:hypothetical protein [Micromonospora halophytica]SCG55333.1 hypothetical protein GA0070560_109138 [Micromonospora halophytica]